jgi:hypothetical protein
LQKKENGSPEPIIKIRASLNKIPTDVDNELELVIFLARKRPGTRPKATDYRQQTLYQNPKLALQEQ